MVIIITIEHNLWCYYKEMGKKFFASSVGAKRGKIVNENEGLVTDLQCHL